jgi:N6-adenosine-specific RNA methylase IME4
VSRGPYLDVFARKQRFNWDTFGDEAFNFGTTAPAAAFVGEAK